MKIIVVLFIAMILSGNCRANDAPKALVYSGPGACKNCPRAIGRILTQLGFTVEFVKPGKLTKHRFQQSKLYVQPGGTDRPNDILEALSKTEILNLKSFVKNGGRYLGICSGGYLAGTYVTDDKKAEAFGLLPIIVDEEDEDANSKLVSINWKHHPYDVYFQDGPSFNLALLPQSQVWATYEKSGHAAAIINNYGKGRVGVIGPHLEADSLWFYDDNLPYPGLRNNLLYDFINSLVK